MKKPSVNQIVILAIVIILSLGVGLAGGFYAKIKLDEAKLISEKEKQTSIANLMTESEIRNLKETIEHDEESYGDNYETFKTYNPYVYNKNPDRIYFKSSKVGAFYVFENGDENFEHLLEVAEDRMHYSAIDDWNLNCFEPDSIAEMMTSQENYIIFDYDNNNLYGFDSSSNIDIILKISYIFIVL